MKSYVSKIQDLEGELQRLKNSKANSKLYADWVDSEGFQSKNALFTCGNEYSSDCDVKPVDIAGNILELVYLYYCSVHLLIYR